MSHTMNLWITLGVLLVCAATVVQMVRLERRPRERLEPRLIPTTPVIIICTFIGLLALVHLANLYGIKTGRH